MRVFLEVSAPKKPPKRVEIKSDVLIGRGKACNLRILSNEVSREHCRLIVRDDSVEVHDLGSSNGTQVDGHTITPKVDFPLEPGATIDIGPLKVVVSFDKVVSQRTVRPSDPTELPSKDKTIKDVPDDAKVKASTVATKKTSTAETERSSEAPEDDCAESQRPQVAAGVSDSVFAAADEPEQLPDEDLQEFDEGLSDDDLIDDGDQIVDDLIDADDQIDSSAELQVASFEVIDTVESSEPPGTETPSEPAPAKKRSFFSFFRRGKDAIENPTTAASTSAQNVAESDLATDATDQAAAVDVESDSHDESDEFDDQVLDTVDSFEGDAAELSAVEFDADAFSVDEGGEANVESPSDDDVDPGFSDFLNRIGQ